MSTKNLVHSLDFAKVGADVTIHAAARIIDPARMELGDSIIIDDFVLLYAGDTGRFRLGSFIHIASFASVSGGGELDLEDFVGLSSGVRIFTGNDDYLGGCLTGPTVPPPYRVPVRSFVRIGKHSIVGANTVILPGVTIGEGGAIGANSLITRDVAPWTICAGSPARLIRDRPKDQILELESRLREELYDGAGRYIPTMEREGT